MTGKTTKAFSPEARAARRRWCWTGRASALDSSRCQRFLLTMKTADGMSLDVGIMTPDLSVSGALSRAACVNYEAMRIVTNGRLPGQRCSDRRRR